MRTRPLGVLRWWSCVRLGVDKNPSRRGTRGINGAASARSSCENLRCGSAISVSLVARCPLAGQHPLLILTALPVLPQPCTLPAPLRVWGGAFAWSATISAGVLPQLHLHVHLDLPPALKLVSRARL